MKQVICMNWGTAYGADYVNRLYNMVERHITGPFRFVCLTDNREGIRPEAELFDCPEIAIPHPWSNAGWRKVTLWDREVPGLEPGSQALFIDLDTVITDSIDCFFDYKPEDGSDFIVAFNWTQKNQGIGNTSVYRFTVGSHPELFDDLTGSPEQTLAEFPNSQTYISRSIPEGAMSFWPEGWCCSFKVHCVPKGMKRWFIEPHLPQGTKIVAFPGSPNPHDALAGNWPAPWHKRIYKHIRPASWVAENWQ